MSLGLSAATWAMVAAATTAAGVYVQNENARKAKKAKRAGLEKFVDEDSNPG